MSSTRYKLIPIGQGFTGTASTVAQIAQRARVAAREAWARPAAAMVVGKPRSALQAARSLRRWLSASVMFQADPLGVELLRTPRAMMEEWITEGVTFGDCDDVAALGAALGLALGMPARLVILAFTPKGPFEHVYTELQADGHWVELDTTRPAQYPADYQAARRETFDV